MYLTKKFIMEKFINMALDFPHMVNQKLPKNNFNDMMESSEGNIASWTGYFYKVSALVVLLGSLIAVLSPVWSGGLGSGAEMIGSLIAILIWVYAAFPIAQVIRSAGDSLASSKSSTVDFVFRDLAVTNIKVLGHVAALVALFGAFCMTLSWATSLNISGAYATDWIANIDYAYSLPMAATAEFTDMIGLGFVGNILTEAWTNWDPTMDAGAAWSGSGLMAVAWEFIGVIVVLAKLYVALALYHFFYGILSSLFNWFKNPSLPIKTS
jgi:hypothetical protein